MGDLYRKDVTALLVSGEEVVLSLRALSESEVVEILEKEGLDFHQLGNPEYLSKSLKAQRALISKSLDDEVPPEKLADLLQFGEASKLVNEVLKISNEPAEKVLSFRK